MNLFSSSLNSLIKNGTKLSVWNSNPGETNDHNITMSYKQISITPAVSGSEYFAGNNTYYMPMKEF